MAKSKTVVRLSAQEAVEKDARYVFQTYGRQPIVLSRGEGALVWDVNGKKYIDCVAGIAVNGVGHCHPRVVKAIQEQAARLIHTSNLYYTDIQPELAEKLCDIAGMDRVFFANSGTESIEGALKLARKKTGKKNFIAAEHCFHGRTMGALSITHKAKYREPFEPLVGGTKFVPYGDASAIKKAITKDTAAVVLEPVQGEGGVNIPSASYLKEVREICDKKDALLVFDEVQTGMGRTGKWFAKEHFGVEPDVMCVAKGIAGGFPMGAMLACEDVAKGLGKGDHASTFGGNPLACAAALGTIDAIESERLLDRSREMGNYMRSALARTCKQDWVDHVRNLGMMIGVQMTREGNALVDKAREKGVLINVASDTVIRLVPPFVITREEIDKTVDVISKLKL